jgi:hypothetical protein
MRRFVRTVSTIKPSGGYMTREKLARLIWKLWKRRNYYKYWYEYEERCIWIEHQKDIENRKEGRDDRSGK